jgi:hypothetical protein
VFEGNLYLNETDWTLTLLSKGFAFIRPEADYYEVYAKAEQEAETLKLGVWADPYIQFLISPSLLAKTSSDRLELTRKLSSEHLNQLAVSEVVSLQEFYIHDLSNK